MIKKMKAAVVTSFNAPLEIQNLDIPKPGPNDLLVKMHVSGICHTDLHAARGDWPVKPNLPRIPGHEGVGEIVSMGSNVKKLFNKGDIVGIPWLHNACGYCEYCLSGKETLCTSQKNSGYGVDGSFAEYALMDFRYTVKCPNNINLIDAAPLYCAGVTTYKALKVSKVKPGQWVSIVGIGGLGHIAIQFAKAMGMKVVAVDRENSNLEKIAKKCGADLFYNGPTDKTGDWIKDKTNGGVHGAIVTAVVRAPFSEALNSIRRGGRIVPVGLPPAKMDVPIFDVVLGGLEIVGSIVGTRLDLVECLQIASDFNIKPITKVCKLEDINDIFNKMEEGNINGRIVIDYR